MEDRQSASSLRPTRTWAEIVDYYRAKGYEGDALWNAIIEASQRYNETIDSQLGF